MNEKKLLEIKMDETGNIIQDIRITTELEARYLHSQLLITLNDLTDYLSESTRAYTLKKGGPDGLD